ncbi:hypothetical protein ID866_9410, partial [Astraeus odoratus]
MPATCGPYLDTCHALPSARSKWQTLDWFQQGNIKFLIATEAAGMGMDIPDIKMVIQFGVPCSLEVWTQRAGCAGCSPDLQAHAILMVEQAMFQQKKKKTQTTDCNTSDHPESAGSNSEEDEACQEH